MSALAWEYFLFCFYILIGPVTWFFFRLGMIKGRDRMELVVRPHLPIPQPAPRVTILIPAKDEGERIRACIESALAQDYPNFSVIAINDRSTDDTGAVMDTVAREHPDKLRVAHIREGTLPEGWTGKCNALHSTVKTADGEWFLFVDSDVVIQPDALSAMLSFGVDKQCDLVSLLPKLESHTFWERTLVPLAGAGVVALYVVAFTNHDHFRKTAFANGQFLLIRRSAYEAIGGHEAVRDRFCEDVEMARILKARGHRIRISWGTPFAAVRMYSSLPSIMRGWSRNFYAGSIGRPWRILLGMFFVIFCAFSAYAALAWGVFRLFHPANTYGAYGWLLTAVIHLVFMMRALGTMYEWSGNPRRGALWFPVAGTMLLAIFCRALKMCVTGRVEWRGTQYTHRMDPALVSKA